MLVYCGQTVCWIKLKLGMAVGLSPGHNTQFSANVTCGQTTEWIKILLGMEVGLCPGNIVVDGDPAPPMERGTVCLCSFRHFLLSVWA